MSLLKELGLCASTSEAKRLVEGGGVRLDGEVQSDPRRILARPAESMLVQVGKRKFARVR
jgi:tyrosyl-tRNA synthetase